MLTDSAYPSNGLIRLTFRGTVERQRLEHSIEQVLPSHPMLTARLEPRRFRPGFRWVQAADAASISLVTELQDGDCSAGTAFSEIRTSDLPCLRFALQQRDGNSVLQFQWHHACSDALGAFSFLADVLKVYRGDLDLSHDRKVRDRDLLRLRFSSGFPRDSVGVFLWKHMVSSLRFVWIRLRKIHPLVEHQPVPIDEAPPADHAAAVSHRFTVDDTNQIRRAAKHHQVSVNTLLLSTMFTTLNTVRKKGGSHPGDWLRISIPVNNRPLAQTSVIPAANVISILYVDRRSREIDDASSLLRSLHREMKDVRSNHHASQFTFTLNGLSLFDGLIARGVRSRRCTTTSLLTNVGRVLCEMPETESLEEVRLPEAVLDDVEIIPPIRPGQTITILACEYAKRMKISMAYDSRIHSEEEAADILQRYVTELYGLASNVRPNIEEANAPSRLASSR